MRNLYANKSGTSSQGDDGGAVTSQCGRRGGGADDECGCRSEREEHAAVAAQRGDATVLPVCSDVIGTDADGGESGGEDGGDLRRGGICGARKMRNEWLQEQRGGDEGTDGIAGETKHDRIAEAPGHQRLARAHRDFPKVDGCTRVDEGGPDKIVIADRCAAGGDKDVLIGGLQEGGGKRGTIVGNDAEIGDCYRQVSEQRGEHKGVRGGEAALAGVGADGNEFIAGRYKRDADAAADGQGGVASDGGESEASGGEAGALGDELLSNAEIGACAADVRRGLRGTVAGEGDGDAGAGDVFLDDDAVRSVGHGGTGEDADCLMCP